MAKAPTFKTLREAAEAGYHGKAVNIEGKGLQKVAFADKAYDKRMAAKSKDKAAPPKPKARPSGAEKGITTRVLPPPPGPMPMNEFILRTQAAINEAKRRKAKGNK